MAELLRRFDVDEAKTKVLAECASSYGVGEPAVGWPNNVLSTRTVAYGNGAIARRGEPVVFATDPDELALCERLSREAKAIVGEIEVGMLSESSDPFHAFFIAANEAVPAPQSITSELIRARFGGTIFPLATITVEPLRPEGTWWSEATPYFEIVELPRGEGREPSEVAALFKEEDDEQRRGYREKWLALLALLALLAWFGGRSEFVDTAFVRVSDYNTDDRALITLMREDKSQVPPGTEMAGSVLPRMALGLTREGSLCGLYGWVVQT